MGGNHKPRGNHASKAIEALNTELTRYISLHRTYNLYIKRKETTVSYTCKRFWSEEMNELGGAMHGEGLPSPLPLSLSPSFPQSHPQSRTNQLALARSQKVPRVSSGLPVGREVPRSEDTTSSACKHIPGRSPWRDRGREGAGGGQVRSGAQPPGRQVR